MEQSLASGVCTHARANLAPRSVGDRTTVLFYQSPFGFFGVHADDVLPVRRKE